MKTSTKNILNLFFTITLCFIVASCNNKKTEANPTEAQTASDFLPSDVQEFGKKLNASFDHHVAAIQKLGSTASVSDVIKASHKVHVDHFGSSHQMSDEHLDRLASNASNKGQWVTINDSLINSMNFSLTGKQLVNKLKNVVSHSTTHDEFQKNLTNFAKELQSVTLPDSELKHIQHKVVALEHSMRYVHENVKTLPGGRTTGYWSCVGYSTLGAAAVSAFSVGLEGAFVAGPIGILVGGVVGGVAGGIAGFAAGLLGCW
ncbi:hypothetical protein BKI52_32890 [marine bacterium AO1-C]|nr:hypothetical protein BKI52_32890 [marine bacterium AO1-C]